MNMNIENLKLRISCLLNKKENEINNYYLEDKSVEILIIRKKTRIKNGKIVNKNYRKEKKNDKE